MNEESVIRLVAEFILLAWGLYITYRTKDKGKALDKALEKIKRQRIEIVVQEERLDEYKSELQMKQAEIDQHKKRTNSRRIRRQGRVEKLKELIDTDSKQIESLFKDDDVSLDIRLEQLEGRGNPDNED